MVAWRHGDGHGRWWMLEEEGRKERRDFAAGVPALRRSPEIARSLHHAPLSQTSPINCQMLYIALWSDAPTTQCA